MSEIVDQLKQALARTADPHRRAAIQALLQRAASASDSDSDSDATATDALHGVAALLAAMTDRPEYAEALVYAQRLRDNVSATERYGDTETHRAERAELIDRINTLTRRVLGCTFVASEKQERKDKHNDTT